MVNDSGHLREEPVVRDGVERKDEVLIHLEKMNT